MYCNVAGDRDVFLEFLVDGHGVVDGARENSEVEE